MNWKPEELELIARLGKMQHSLKNVAIALQVPEIDLLAEFENEESEAFKAYHRAKILADLDIREAIYELAKGGSSAAQTLFKQFMDDAKSF